MTDPQTIKKNGRPEYAVLPWDEYLRLKAVAASASDEEIFDRAKAAAMGSDPLPNEIAKRLFVGENAVRALRGFRNLKLKDLADATGTSRSYLSEIEHGKPASVAVLRRIADKLNVSLDLLVPAH